MAWRWGSEDKEKKDSHTDFFGSKNHQELMIFKESWATEAIDYAIKFSRM